MTLEITYYALSKNCLPETPWPKNWMRVCGKPFEEKQFKECLALCGKRFIVNLVFHKPSGQFFNPFSNDCGPLSCRQHFINKSRFSSPGLSPKVTGPVLSVATAQCMSEKFSAQPRPLSGISGTYIKSSRIYRIIYRIFTV